MSRPGESVIINLTSGEIVALNGAQGRRMPHGFDFSRDGSRLVGWFFQGAAQVWNTSTGDLMSGPFGDQVVGAAISPDGSLVLTGSGDHTAQLWQVASGAKVGPPLIHENIVKGVDFTPDGLRFFTGGFDAYARVWNASSYKPIGRPVHQYGEIKNLVCSPDGSRFLVGLANGTARLWDSRTLQPVGEPLVHRMTVVEPIAFSPSGKMIGTGSNDGMARIWDATTGKPIGPPLQCKDSIRCISFSSDGQSLVYSGGYEGLYVWRLPSQPIEGDAEWIKLWTEVVTGLTLNTEAQPVTRVLSAQEWRDKNATLQSLGTSRMSDSLDDGSVNTDAVWLETLQGIFAVE